MGKRRFFRLSVLLIAVFWAFSHTLMTASPLHPEASQLYKQAEDSYRAKDLPKAAELLKKALELEPDNAVYRYVLGRVLFEQRDFLGARECFEIVSRSRPSPDKGADYNERLKNFKQRIRTMQDVFNQQGQEKFSLYLKNQDSPERVRLAMTIYHAFRLSPPLRYRNFEKLTKATEIYEEALQKSINGQEWQKGPMLQLAFLYEIANQKGKAAEVYMRALDYVENPNEEFIITHRFDYLNRSNREKLLDTIEAGEFTRKDLEELVGESSEELSEEDRDKFEGLISDARSQLEDATTDEERNQVVEEIKQTLIEKQKSGQLPGHDRLQKKLDAEGKTMEDYMKEQGF